MSEEARRSGARGLFLFRGGRRDGERAEVGGELFGVEASAGAGPALRGELEVAVFGPMRQDAQDVAQVELGVELVQSGGGDEGEEVACGLGVVVGSNEEPGDRWQCGAARAPRRCWWARGGRRRGSA